MKMKYVLIIGLALSVSAANIFAQDGDRPNKRGPRPDGPREGQGERHKGPPPPVFSALDANHDETISADEIANSAAALNTLDKNSDGQLTKEELMPLPPKQGEGQRPQNPPPGDGGPRERKDVRIMVPPVIAVLDADKDRTISAAEISGAPASLAKLDKNADGQLTKEELHPMPPKK